MDKIKKSFIDFGQKFLLVSVFYVVRVGEIFRSKHGTNQQWVIGTDEIAGVLGRIGEAFPNARVINFTPNKLSSESYSFSIQDRRFSYLKRLLVGPILLGIYSAKHFQFFYVWSTGFLLNREFEIDFLRRHDCKIAVMCCGSEIRSIEKQRELTKQLGRDSFVNYDPYVMSVDDLTRYENTREDWARTLVTKVDVVFNAPNCQTSYIPDSSENVFVAHGFYFARKVVSKPSDRVVGQKIRVIHAPSSLNTKGTMLVRAAISSLRRNRDDFEYIELFNEPHSKVMHLLQTSHICLNQFLSFGTGIFGLEAMAAGNAVLMSADPEHEPSILPWIDEQSAWVVTQPWEIERNLSMLLDEPSLCTTVGEEAIRYINTYYSKEAARERLLEPLRERGLLN
jgi:hypothetical protein